MRVFQRAPVNTAKVSNRPSVDATPVTSDDMREQVVEHALLLELLQAAIWSGHVVLVGAEDTWKESCSLTASSESLSRLLELCRVSRLLEQYRAAADFELYWNIELTRGLSADRHIQVFEHAIHDMPPQSTSDETVSVSTGELYTEVPLPSSEAVPTQTRAAVRRKENVRIQFQCPPFFREGWARQAAGWHENKAQTTPKAADSLAEVRGMLSIGLYADKPSGATALCIVRNKVLMLVLKTAPKAFSESENDEKVLARIPISDLEVTLSPGKPNLFQVKTKGHDDVVFCFAKDQTDRNKWIAVFRRMEVGIFAELDGHRHCLQPAN
jgi:hypothetical protein